jgi:hypothetical protein
MAEGGVPLATKARRRGVGLAAAGWVAAAPFLALACAWALGRVAGDRTWPWQALFWIPALAAVVACGTAWLVLRLTGRGARGALAGRVVAVALGAWALLVMVTQDVGWGGWGAARRAELTVTHWNARWPGRQALECGRALAPVLGDVTVISNPGAIVNRVVADVWLPEDVRAGGAGGDARDARAAGAFVRDLGPVAVVARIPVTEFRLLEYQDVPEVGVVWAAWLTVAPGAGSDEVRILVIDLPSDPKEPRGRVADALEAMLARHPEAADPDLVVGDTNCTPGSVVFGRCFARLGRCEPWRASGWLPTYPRERPFWRIDAMLAQPSRLLWSRYRTIDLGVGAHKAQQGAFERNGP